MIKIENKSICYNFKEILKIKNLVINDGQVVGVFGKNGAGKTSLLNAIAGNISFTGNEKDSCFLIDDKRFSYKIYYDLAYITDGMMLNDNWNAMMHMKTISMYYKKFDEPGFIRLMELFEIDKRKPVKKFSKGQRTKLEMALGLCKNTKYIVIDEPFLGNDPFTRSDFLKIMAGMLKDDTVVIIATQYIDEIQNFIDRAIFIDNKGIVKDVLMDDIIDEGQNILTIAKDCFNVDENKVLQYLL